MREKLIPKLIGLILALAAACILFVSPWFGGAAPSSQQAQSSSSLAQASSIPSAATSAPISSSGGTSFVNELPTGILLRVENILQYPELPNGCEATSLTTVLNYLGFSAEKTDISANYIPTQPFVWENGMLMGGDPEEVYVGDATGDGYYCYASPVAIAANKYLRENGSELRAKQYNGIDEDGLIELLTAGTPIIVWKTVDNLPLRSSSFSWTLQNNEGKYNPLVNVHVVVLIGYDAENFYFCDPLEINRSMPREDFMPIFEQMSSRAVAIE